MLGFVLLQTLAQLPRLATIKTVSGDKSFIEVIVIWFCLCQCKTKRFSLSVFVVFHGLIIKYHGLCIRLLVNYGQNDRSCSGH